MSWLKDPSLVSEYLDAVKMGTRHHALRRREAVPDRETAIALARIVWKPIYGALEHQQPFEAVRVEDVWVVSGSLPSPKPGGVAQAVVRAADACFLNVTHGR